MQRLRLFYFRELFTKREREKERHSPWRRSLSAENPQLCPFNSSAFGMFLMVVELLVVVVVGCGWVFYLSFTF